MQMLLLWIGEVGLKLFTFKPRLTQESLEQRLQGKITCLYFNFFSDKPQVK